MTTQHITATNVVDHGSIVQLWATFENGRQLPINFDRRPFASFYEQWAAAGFPDNLLLHEDEDGIQTVEI